jgi:phosphinothricin acetyltransferase
MNIHSVLAGIALPNAASVRLCEKFGFAKVAQLKEVGFKLNQWVDVGYWELILNDFGEAAKM